jgi:hypothetical protein
MQGCPTRVCGRVAGHARASHATATKATAAHPTGPASDTTATAHDARGHRSLRNRRSRSQERKRTATPVSWFRVAAPAIGKRPLLLLLSCVLSSTGLATRGLTSHSDKSVQQVDKREAHSVTT